MKSILAPKIISTLFMMSVATSVTAGPVEYITNGGFESGDFTGWDVMRSDGCDFACEGGWTINDGTFDPPGPGDPLPPISGSYDAVSWQQGPGLSVMTKPITLPYGITSAVLRWSDRIRNHASVFSDPNQEWRVLIKDTGGTVLEEVFSTNPGDPLEQLGPNVGVYDLTSLAQTYEGEEIVLSFEQQDDLLFFNATLDDVSLEIDTCDVDASLQYGQMTIDTTPGHGDQDHARFKMTGLTDLGDIALPGDVDLTFTAETPDGIAYTFSGTGTVEGNKLSLHQEAGDGEEKITCRLSTELCVIFIERDVDIDETVLDANPVTLSLEVNGTKYCHSGDWTEEVFPERTVYTY
ncbi:MAG: hypothetical protein ACL93V_02635 [Candidatus Electrothrix sp. YB6]